MTASSAGSRSKAAIPPASMSASSPNGLTVDRSVTTPVRVAELADDPARCVGLHDVAAMDALLDAVAQLAGEDRRDDPAAFPRRASTDAPTWGVAGTAAAGTIDGSPGRAAVRATAARARIPRRLLRWVRTSMARSPRTALRPHVSQHPAVLHKLAILRDEQTEPKKFREVVRELSWLLGYEALADVRVRPLEIRTPLEPMTAHELGERVGFVPILRAGLGMVDAMLELMPTAQVWHLGLFRDERTLRPVEYYNKLPDSATVDLCLILDPMLATGGSATAAIEVLKKWGAVQPVRIKLVNLIAAPEGVEAVSTAHPDVEIYCAALDRSLNEKGYIQPGLGDAGDRQFGTGRSD